MFAVGILFGIFTLTRRCYLLIELIVAHHLQRLEEGPLGHLMLFALADAGRRRPNGLNRRRFEAQRLGIYAASGRQIWVHVDSVGGRVLLLVLLAFSLS